MVSSHEHNLDLRGKQTFEIFLFAAYREIQYSLYTLVIRVFECHKEFSLKPV